MNAWEELVRYLEEGEKLEAFVFGGWGGEPPIKGEEREWQTGYTEPEPPPIPFDKRGKILAREEAKPMMQNWKFYGGYGGASAYAVRIWTNKRVIWVTQYDGLTVLDSAPRNPTAHIPDMPGG